MAVVLGRGNLARIEVALSNWLVELGGYQGKLLGEQLARMVPCGLEIRVSDQAADVAVGIDEVRAGERARRLRRQKGKDGEDGKGAPPGGRELACLARGRTNWRLNWCW